VFDIWGWNGGEDILMVAFASVGGKKEREALEVLKQNASSIADVVKKFEDLIKAFFLEHDLEKASRYGKELSTLETEADNGRRKFMRILHEGAFLPTFRGDLARLADRLDRIADTTEGAARAILQRKKLTKAFLEAERKNPKVKEFASSLVKMADLTTKTVLALRDSVSMLTTDIDKALKKSQSVNRLEHQIDEMEAWVFEEMYEHERYFDPLSVVQLSDVLHRFENISDRAEDASDLIEIIAYTFRA